MLVVGVEKMTDLPGPEIAQALLSAAYLKEESEIEGGFAGVFGQIAQRYFQRHGDQSDALATIAAKNHRNGCANPLAQMRKDLGFEFCRQVSDKNPLVAGPLKRTDCSLVSDGAAALVLTDVETALGMSKAVVFRAAVQVNDFLPMSRRDVTLFEGCTEAWRRARDKAGVGLDDLDFVETHDCFTIAELIEYEAMGLTERGQGARRVRGLDAEGRPAAGQPVRRAEGQGPPDRRDRRLDARALGDAADRNGRRHADRGRETRRPVQHGRRRGRQLRLDPRAAAVESRHPARPPACCRRRCVPARFGSVARPIGLRQRVSVSAMALPKPFHTTPWPRSARVMAKDVARSSRCGRRSA